MEIKYKLPTKEDHEILAKCEKLEGLDLTQEDRVMVQLIKSQLEDDWRKPLLKKLEALLKKYHQG